MRSISHAGFLRACRGVWLWFAGFTYGLGWQGYPPRRGWEGATPGWSPAAAVEAAGPSDGWDLDGWLRDSQRELHAALNRVEQDLRAGLIGVRERAYEMRECVA